MTDNWCQPHDPLTGAGCQWWTDPKTPPSIAVCGACPVTHVFCNGCAARPSCRLAVFPKHFPRVTRFLQRFNLARDLHVPMWTCDSRDVPLADYLMAVKAVGTVNECSAERLKKVKGNG